MAASRVLPALPHLAHESCRLNGQVLSASCGRVALTDHHMTRGWGSDILAAEDVATHLDEICDRTDPPRAGPSSG